MSQPFPPDYPPSELLIRLQDASQALARVRVDEEGILGHLQEQIRRLLPPSRIHVLLFMKDGIKRYAWRRTGEALPPSYFDTPAGQGIVGWLRQTRESLLVRDFERDWELLPAKPTYVNPDPPRSAIFVPLVVADEALGALSVQSDEPDIYTPDHLWQLKILANQAAAAFRASRLLRSEQWRAQQLRTLAEVTRTLASILDLDALLSRVVDIIEESFGYYHVQVFIYDADKQKAVFRASSQLNTHEEWRKVGRSLKPGEGIIGWVLDHGEPLLAPDVSIDPVYIPDDPRLLPDTRSEVAVPLRLEKEILGVLDVQSDQLNAFDREDLFILNALADAVALAVANARLYARVQEDAWITVALLEVAEATSRLQTLDEVVETITRITPLLTGVVSCAIWMRDREPEVLRPAGQWGIHEEMVRIFQKNALVAAENPGLILVERTGQPLVMRSPEWDELLQPIVAQMLLSDAIVLMPLVARAEMIGVMAVSLEEQTTTLSEDRIPLLKGIADQAAAAIHNTTLLVAHQEEAWVSTALLQVAQAIGQAEDLSQTLNVVARLTAALSGLDRCTILLRDGSDSPFYVSISYNLRRDLPSIEPANDDFASMSLLSELVNRRQAIRVERSLTTDLIQPELTERYQIGALVAVPLLAGEQVLGALLVDEVKSEHVGNPRLLDILDGIANLSAVAIERARLQQAEMARQRIATELAVAHNIQKGFLPEFLPQIPGYDIQAIWEPARQIGGDFYDFIPLPDGRLGLVIADVADKGIPAALYMALSRTTIRLVTTSDPSPAVALQRVNTAILDTTYSDLFVTVFYAIIDPAHDEVTYASGGHGLALKTTADEIVFLRGHGTVLGVLPTISIKECSTTLVAGDYLVLYTDGVTDAPNQEMEAFGEMRLSGLLERHRGCSASEMLGIIHRAVREWQGNETPFDDFTLVVVRRELDLQ